MASEPSASSEPLPEGAVLVHSVSLHNLNTTANLFDLSHAEPGNIRLLECKSVVEQGLLRVVEFAEFPTIPYAAISYPWRGVAPHPSDSEDPAFSARLKNAEDADPVGVDALRSACAAALRLSCAYLWVDRLCIMQTSKKDRMWQIGKMYHVYRSCRVCIVLAGGLRRLVRLDEQTPWIHRSWTLQEVLAPPSTVVLIRWKLGPGRASSGDLGVPVLVEEAIPGASAYIPLPLVLQVCTTGTLPFTSTPSPTHPVRSTMVKACIFSAIQQDAPRVDEIPFWQPQRRIFSPNVVALAVAMDQDLIASDPEIRNYAVWQSALMRTSSRPVDMVLSIMGLFGVKLNPSTYGEHDRRRATVDLAREILAKGGSASWMGAAFRLDPDPCLSTFPQFPQTSVEGVALVRTKEGVREVSGLVGPMYPIQDALVPLPRGSMDKEGYVTFTARSVRISPLAEVSEARAPDNAEPGGVLQALDGSQWRICDEQPSSPTANSDPAAYAILLGWFHKYHPGASPANGETLLVILAQGHQREPERFHVRSFFTLRAIHKPQVLRWPEREFSLGGPDPLPEGSSTAPEKIVETYVESSERWPRMPWSKPIVTAEDEAIRKARWAVPQQVLERHWQ